MYLAHGGRESCDTSTFSGMTAAFFMSRYSPCHGTITFAIDPSGVLTIVSSDVYIPTMYLTGPAPETLQGSGPKVTSCTVTLNGDQADVQWTAQGVGITDFGVGVVNGQNGSVTVAGTERTASLSLRGEKPGTITVVIGINGDDHLMFPCPDISYLPAPGQPMVDRVVPLAGGLATVNFSVADPLTVQGVEVKVDRGGWTRPGGQSPIGGSGGAFTLTGLTPGTHSVMLRSTGWDSVTTTDGMARSFVIPTPAAAPSAGTTGVTVGSPASKPVPVPPKQPASSVPGTSDGVEGGTHGALAANTGDAGIDAPCLAKDGRLYPTLYGTVGSQLTMAPNTHGMDDATSFTVVGGALPPGMQLDRRFGIVFGVPSESGSWTTTVQARFANGGVLDGQFSTRVDADEQMLQYAAQNIGSVDRDIAIAPSTNAPSTGTSYQLVCGTLPAGTALGSRSGRITGRPTEVVDRPVSLRIAETSRTGSAAASFIFVVDRADVHRLHYPAHPHVRVGKSVFIRPTVSGSGEIALFRMWKGKLPKGLRLDPVSGVITGRIRHGGPTHTITIVAVTKAGALLTAAPTRLSLGDHRR